MTENMRACQTCLAYDNGYCKAEPPATVFVGHDQTNRQTVFPHVKPDDYCMVWKYKPGTAERDG